jgi:hypothetical protein
VKVAQTLRRGEGSIFSVVAVFTSLLPPQSSDFKAQMIAQDDRRRNRGQREIPTDAWLPFGEPPIARD